MSIIYPFGEHPFETEIKIEPIAIFTHVLEAWRFAQEHDLFVHFIQKDTEYPFHVFEHYDSVILCNEMSIPFFDDYTTLMWFIEYMGYTGHVQHRNN